MHKLLIPLDWGKAARSALVNILVMLGLVAALAGCSGSSPLGNMGYGDEHPADAPGDMPGH